MVPGAFKTVIPNFAAKPLLGLTWDSYPSGRDILRPVGIIFRSKGCRVIAASKTAFRSTPAEAFVA